MKILGLIFKGISVTLVGVLVGVILVATIHGVAGNPTPAEIVENLKEKGKPFELSPERARYALILSTVENGSFEFTKDIAAIAVPDLGTTGGKYVSLFAPGVSMFAIPFYLVGRAVNLAQVVTFSMSSVYALLNVILITLIVRKLTANIYAGLAAGITFLFGTTAWAYAATLYQHHVSTLLLLLAYYILLHKNHILSTLVIGFLFGVSIFVEYPNGILFIPFMFWLLWKHFEITEKDRLTQITFSFSFIFVFMGFAIGLLPSLWYNQNAYGNPMQLSGTLKSVRTLDVATESAQLVQTVTYKKKTALGFFKYERLPQGFDVLLTSQDRGVLYFSPVILLGLLGFSVMRKKYPDASTALGGGLIVLFVLYAMWGDPWGGWAFGTRYLIPAFAMLAIPLGVAIAAYGNKLLFGLSYLVLLNYSVFINLAGVLTTNQIPPSVEQDSLLLPKPTFIHNINLLYQGISSSYVFRQYIGQIMTLVDFAAILYAVIVVMACVLFLFAAKKARSI